MCFVHRDQRQPDPRQAIHRAVAQQPLRRDVQQIKAFLDQVAGDGSRFRRVDFRMQRAGVDTDLTKRRHLVVHQRDQRRDDDRGAGTAQRRHLIADALAATGRHQHKGVAASHHMVDCRILLAAKAGKTENLAQHLRGIAKRGWSRHSAAENL